MGDQSRKYRVVFPLFALLISTVVLVLGGHLLGGAGLSAFAPALAASPQIAPLVEQVDPASVVSSADATIAVLGADFEVVISGTQIITRPLVLLDGDPLTEVGWVSSAWLTATVPAGYAVGVYDVTVQNPDGLSDTLVQALTVQHPTPQLTALDPISGTFGQPLTLSIAGSDFISTPAVFLGTAHELAVAYVSSTMLTATVPATLTPGYYDLTVQNPGPGDVTDWMSDAFTLYSPIPTLRAVDPRKTYNDMDTPLVITGTNFAPTPQVMLGNTPLQNVTWLSMTQITAQIPWGMAPGTYPLTVTNPAPGTYSATLTRAITMTEGFNTWTTGGPYGGHIQELVHHPLHADRLYAMATDVGIFASTDAGLSWEMILREDYLTRISFDAQNPDVIYIGGDGSLLRTMDGGLTWDVITPQLEPWTQAFNVYRPLAHPTQGCVLYTAKRTPDEPDAEAGGVYWSNNCGDSWQKWGDENSGLSDTHVVDMAFHPDNAATMILGTQSGNVFRSADGGRNWSLQAHVAAHIEKLYYSPFGDHEAWVLSSPPRGESNPPFAYTSTNLTSWTPVTIADGGGNSYPVTDLVFPAPDTIWAAMGYGVISYDGGATWSDVPGWAGVLAEDNVVSFAIESASPDVIHAGYAMGGVAQSIDGGGTWQRTSQGLAGVLPYALALAPDDLETLYAYTTRGLLKSENGGHSWRSLEKWIGGRTGNHLLAVDPVMPDRVYLGQSCDDALCLWVSEDGGETWREVSAALPATFSGYSTAINVLSPHPMQDGRIFAGVAFNPPEGNGEQPTDGGIFISDDHGEHWAFLTGSEPLSNVTEIAYDAVNPNLIYAGTAGSGIWKSVTGGATWQQLNVPGLAPPVGVGSMATHPDLANVLLARLLSSADTENPPGILYITRNAGAGWTELDEGTSDAGLWFAPPAPQMPPYMLYTGCAGSACRSMDVGDSWNTIYGVPRPTAMVAGTDGERIVLYAASPGGMAAAEEGTHALTDRGPDDDIPGLGNVLGSGVYRTTLQPFDQDLYLPLLTRQALP